MPERIVVGEFGRTFGLEGWLKVRSFTQPEDRLWQYEPWWLREAEVPLSVVERNPRAALVKLQGVDSPEAAQIYVKQLIYISRAVLPILSEDEAYWADLIGLTVIDPKRGIYGKVVELLATGANDCLIVKDKQRRMLIPYLRKVILFVDLTKKTILVDWEPI